MTSLANCLGNAATGEDMVLFDEVSVVEADAVILATAAGDCDLTWLTAATLGLVALLSLRLMTLRSNASRSGRATPSNAIMSLSWSSIGSKSSNCRIRFGSRLRRADKAGFNICILVLLTNAIVSAVTHSEPLWIAYL